MDPLGFGLKSTIKYKNWWLTSMAPTSFQQIAKRLRHGAVHRRRERGGGNSRMDVLKWQDVLGLKNGDLAFFGGPNNKEADMTDMTFEQQVSTGFYILEYDDLILDDRSKYGLTLWGWIPAEKNSLFSSEMMGARWYPKLKKRAVCWNNFVVYSYVF